MPIPRVPSGHQRVGQQQPPAQPRQHRGGPAPAHAVRGDPGHPHHRDGDDQREVGDQQGERVDEVQLREVRADPGGQREEDDHGGGDDVDDPEQQQAQQRPPPRPVPRPHGEQVRLGDVVRRGAGRRRPAHRRRRDGRRRCGRPRHRRRHGTGPATGGQCRAGRSQRSGRRVGGGPAYGSSPGPGRVIRRTVARSARARRPGGRGCARGPAAPSTRTAAGRPCGR